MCGGEEVKGESKGGEEPSKEGKKKGFLSKKEGKESATSSTLRSAEGAKGPADYGKRVDGKQCTGNVTSYVGKGRRVQ